MLSFILIQNRQYVSELCCSETTQFANSRHLIRRGKTRLAKWYVPYDDDEKIKLKGEVRASHLSILFSPYFFSPPLYFARYQRPCSHGFLL